MFYPDICNDCWMKNFCRGQCLNNKSIPLDDERSIVGCRILDLLWESTIKGYIYLKEKTNKTLSEYF